MNVFHSCLSFSKLRHLSLLWNSYKKGGIWKWVFVIKANIMKNSEHLQKEENCKCRKKTMLFSPFLCLSEMDTSSFCLSTSSRKSPSLSLGLNAPSLEILLYILFLPHIWHRLYGEGNGNPLQYSCLENPMDGGAWCRLLSMGSQRVGHDWAISLHFVVERVPSLCVNSQ